MRKQQTYGSTGSSVLDPADGAAVRPEGRNAARRTPVEPPRGRRELVDDFAEDTDTEAFLRASGRNRRIRRGLLPQTRGGRIVAGVCVLISLATVAGGVLLGAQFVTSNPRFRIPSSQSIEIDGNSHLTRAQMISIFGEDIDRNIFHVPLEQRRAQLEQMPWVDHATVMRLLPNRVRVQVSERTPVAFARQGSAIGMVDANGVLLDIPPDAPGNPSYSFPVITGLKAEDSPHDRAERMKLYSAFVHDLDSTGKGISAQLSEVDLSDPEDIKALLPDHNVEVLVHFGTENFLSRYDRFQEHLPEWRAQYPRLSSVDMRYERQVVLQMPPKDATAAVASAGTSPEATESASAAASSSASPHAAVSKPSSAAATSHPSGAAPHPAAASPHSVSHPPAHPATHAATAADHPVGGKSAVSAEKQAAMRKRVEAIKAWMAKREKMRAAARASQ